MGLVGFHFTAKQSTNRFLFFEWDSESIDIYQSAQAVTLDVDVFNAVQSSIETRLGDKAKTFVMNTPLA